MKWDWMGTKRIGIAKSWFFNFPSASHDKCLKCGVERGVHGRDHLFVEQEKTNDK